MDRGAVSRKRVFQTPSDALRLIPRKIKTIEG